jgi:hypothetical protein
MRLLDPRKDAPLAAGLLAGTVVLFQQPLRWLLEAKRGRRNSVAVDRNARGRQQQPVRNVLHFAQ